MLGLTGKEKTIFEERMIAEQPLTLQEIGDKFLAWTRERGAAARGRS